MSYGILWGAGNGHFDMTVVKQKARNPQIKPKLKNRNETFVLDFYFYFLIQFNMKTWETQPSFIFKPPQKQKSWQGFHLSEWMD